MKLPTAGSTIGEVLQSRARNTPGVPAYIDRGDPISFADMDASVDRIACGLLGLGLARGDRIGLLALNQIEWLQVFFAAARIGVGVIGLNVRYRESELETMLGDDEAKALFTLSQQDGFDFLALVGRLLPKLPSLRHVVTLDAPGSALDLCTLARTQVDPEVLARARSAVDADDLAMVIYTSGTTGRPKGAALTHRTMLAAAAAQASHIRAGAGDRLQLALPLNHVGGITCSVLALLLAGGCCELVPVFRAELVLAMTVSHPPTIVIGVPTMLRLLLMQLDTVAADLSQVRLVVTGGANADDTLLRRLQQTMPRATVMNLYGLSEASGALVMTPWDCSREDLMRSIGAPLTGVQLRVVDTACSDVPAGDVGELWFRGLGVFSGYVNPGAQGESFAADGWLRTGDLGSVDARGMIRLMGRSKDMYIQGGYNVYPAEIEALIAQHPEVQMVAGIGVPDPVLGEVGRYYVVPRPGSSLGTQDIRDHCARHLADYKVPRQIVLRAELPLTPAGKIHKAALRAEAPPEAA